MIDAVLPEHRDPVSDHREPVPDHRELGRDMRIFDSSPLVGPGLPLWLPAGAAVRYELEQYAREVALRTGCEPVYSPVLGKRSLYERSGHWAKFADDMFPPMSLGGPGPGSGSGSGPDCDGHECAGDGHGGVEPDADPFVLRPANCPHHAQVYASEPRSYRDLPVRYSELASMFPRGTVRGAVGAQPRASDQPGRRARLLPARPDRCGAAHRAGRDHGGARHPRDRGLLPAALGPGLLGQVAG